jgi:hypothetical protein
MLFKKDLPVPIISSVFPTFFYYNFRDGRVDQVLEFLSLVHSPVVPKKAPGVFQPFITKLRLIRT